MLLSEYKVAVSKQSIFSETNTGFLETKNSMGVMNTYLNEYTNYIVSTLSCNDKLLDIGCAFGLITIKSLEKSAMVVACDISNQHLEHLKEKTIHFSGKLILLNRRFPEELNFKENSFSSVVLANVLQFLTPLEIATGLDSIFRWLKPGGRLCITCITPHFRPYMNGERVYKTNKANGQEWPGYIQTKISAPEIANFLPKMFHLFEPDDLRNVLISHQFQVEKYGYFSYPDDQFPDEFRNNDLEYCGTIAIKPAC